MSADSELLIKIKTILESQGLDAAKAKLAELTQTNNAAGLSEASVNRERSKSEIQSEKTAKAILAMNGAMQGGMGPFRAAIHVANQLGGSYAAMAFKIAAVGAAITIGWRVGTMLREWFTGAKEVEGEMEKLKKVSEELRDRVAKLSAVRLSNLKADADEIAKGFSTAVDKAERLKRLTDLREDAQLASDLAGLELRFNKKEINQNERDRLEIQYTHDSQVRKHDAEGLRITSEEGASNQRESQVRRKAGELSRKAGMANQDYDQAVQTIKEAGIDDPENLIAEGVDSSKYKALLDEARQRLKYAISQQKANLENILVNHDLQGPIDDQRVSVAQQKMDALSKTAELPGLRTVRDSAKKDFEAYRPIHDEVLSKETIRREELDADKEVLVNKYEQTRAIKQKGLKVIDNRISDDFDKSVAETASPAEKARTKGSELLDSFRLDYQTVRNNAGDPLSGESQKQFDASRLSEANNLAKAAVNKAYNGGDPNAVMIELLAALRQIAARPVFREDQIQALLTDIRNLKGQQQASSGLN